MRIAFLIATVGLVLFANEANAVLELNGSSDTAYKALGSQYQGRLLSFDVIMAGVGTTHASATYFNNQFAITAAHTIVDRLQFDLSYEVATGDNYLTNRGTVVPVDSVLIYPGYVSGFPKNTIDLAILHLSTPLSGIPADIHSVAVGDTITTAGFGRVGTPSTGLNSPQDGYSRGWLSPVDNFSAIDVSDTYYFQTFFGSSTGLVLNGKGASGDSGGPAYDTAGNLVGLGVAVSLPDASTVGHTYYLDLSQPQVHDWIVSNTAVPEPSSIYLLFAGALVLLLRLRRQPFRGCR